MDKILTPVPESDLQASAQRIQDNLQMMHAYFDALFTADMNPMLELFDQDIEWLIVPTGDTIKGKEEIAKLAANHGAASPGGIKTLVNLFASEEFAYLEYRTGGTLTNQADFPSIKFEPSGKKCDFLCCFAFHITNGKIDRVHEYFDIETVKRQLGDPAPGTDLAQAITNAMTSDDSESMVNLFAPDGEWVIMATGETFRGHDQIRQLARRSVAARGHTDGMGIKPTNVFTNDEGTKLCWEYVHTGVVTDKWPASSHKVAPGTRFDLPILLVCDIRQGKLAKIREYFDLLTLLEPATSHRLYS